MNTVTNAPAAFTEKNPASPASPRRRQLGWWTGEAGSPAGEPVATVLRRLDRPVYVVEDGGRPACHQDGRARLAADAAAPGELPLLAYLPPLDLRDLGDAGFCHDHGIRLAYMTGAMANGIASVRLVEAVAGAGLLGSFGAAGLPVGQIEQAVLELKSSPNAAPFCANLIHSPNEKGQEAAVVDLYLRHGVSRVEASAYMALTLPVVRYRVMGIHRDAGGNIVTPNRIIAKASRVEVATRWFSPPPEKLLQQLVAAGDISPAQAALAARVPMAQDLTVEADSGGHTDNRPAITLLPTMLALRDRLQAGHAYDIPLRVGAAGGIATPASAAAAFAMGAAYIVTGTVNQACVESGSSDTVRQMLAEAGQADVAMAPAVDMFEMGVKLQVLKRGTMFAMRANKLYEIYRACDSLDDIPAAERRLLETTLFKAPLDKIWLETEAYFRDRDAGEIDRASRDPKHKMALVFRWYLGLSSRWANRGEPGRQVDYQVWCGPAMGAFNEWAQGTPLELPGRREVVNVALNLMYGAAVITRLTQLRQQGVRLETPRDLTSPLPSSEIEEYLA